MFVVVLCFPDYTRPGCIKCVLFCACFVSFGVTHGTYVRSMCVTGCVILIFVTYVACSGLCVVSVFFLHNENTDVCVCSCACGVCVCVFFFLFLKFSTQRVCMARHFCASRVCMIIHTLRTVCTAGRERPCGFLLLTLYTQSELRWVCVLFCALVASFFVVHSYSR